MQRGCYGRVMAESFASSVFLAGIASHEWAYPALEAVHIVGVGLLLGSLVVFELRVWGAGAALPLAALARLALRLTVAGFLIAAASGLVMFATAPDELLANPAFRLKFLLLAAAGVNLAVYRRRGAERVDAIARAQTALSLGLWLGVIICGRWIAYA